MDETELRMKILVVLYESDKRNPGCPVSSDELKEILDGEYDEVDYNELFSNADYLKGDGYIELEEFLGNDFEVKITPQGKVKVEKGD